MFFKASLPSVTSSDISYNVRGSFKAYKFSSNIKNSGRNSTRATNINFCNDFKLF